MTRPASEHPEAASALDERYFSETYGVTACRPFSQHWWSVRLYAGVARRLLRRHGGRRMLEVGCGFGFILGALEDEFETWGIDGSEHAIAQCRVFAPRSRCAVADLEHDLPSHLADLLRPAAFDLILACYVLEHLRDPLAAMRRIAALLRPGGWLFFSVPNTESLGARWKGKEWYAVRDPTHRSLLPPDEWLRIVHDTGLETVKEFSDGYWDLPYVRWLPRWVQLPVFIAPSALECLLARPILPPRFGENVIVIARKPAGESAP